MREVQKHNICINVPSSQTFRSHLKQQICICSKRTLRSKDVTFLLLLYLNTTRGRKRVEFLKRGNATRSSETSVLTDLFSFIYTCLASESMNVETQLTSLTEMAYRHECIICSHDHKSPLVWQERRFQLEAKYNQYRIGNIWYSSKHEVLCTETTFTEISSSQQIHSLCWLQKH
jgi:hypothetical protein